MSKVAKVANYGTFAGSLVRADDVAEHLSKVCGELAVVKWRADREHWGRVLELLDEANGHLGELSGLLVLAKQGAMRYRALNWQDGGRV